MCRREEGSGSVVGDRGVGTFPVLAAVVELVIEHVWGRLEAMVGRGPVLVGGKTGSGRVGGVRCSLGWASRVQLS